MNDLLVRRERLPVVRLPRTREGAKKSRGIWDASPAPRSGIQQKHGIGPFSLGAITREEPRRQRSHPSWTGFAATAELILKTGFLDTAIRSLGVAVLAPACREN